jgi:hypothetical protein
MGMLMSVNRIIKYPYVKVEYEWEVIEENIPGKEVYPPLTGLHDVMFVRLKRISDGLIFETRQDNVEGL